MLLKDREGCRGSWERVNVVGSGFVERHVGRRPAGDHNVDSPATATVPGLTGECFCLACIKLTPSKPGRIEVCNTEATYLSIPSAPYYYYFKKTFILKFKTVPGTEERPPFVMS